MINAAPTADFQVRVSPRKITAKITVSARLSLSIPATLDTSPICNALK